MLPCRRFPLFPVALAALAACLAGGVSAQPQRAHTHGRLSLDVAVDAKNITLRMQAPLDGFLGFEHAPRNEAQRQQVAAMVQRLKAADKLFAIDPKAACKLENVALHAPVLGLGTAAAQASSHAHAHDHDDDDEDDHDHDHGHDHDHAHDHEHADLDADIVFSCKEAAAARFIDARALFAAFPRVHAADVQSATPKGQAKASLRPDAARLDW